uniref:Peptidase M24 domain-containing protein n=1 Tax=Oncorhynchus tshawytscha TaxID=74940 RepID=A0A8C8K2A7_ONCTS
MAHNAIHQEMGVASQCLPGWPDYIEIKDQEQIQGLTRACQLARQILLLAGRRCSCDIVGMTTEEIDFIVHQETIRHNAYPSPEIWGFPKSVCTSSITWSTFLIGYVDEVGQKLAETARKCRDEAIAACKPGAPLCVIGNTIRYTHTGYLCSYFHGHPVILHHANDNDMTMGEGMSFTIGQSHFLCISVCIDLYIVSDLVCTRSCSIRNHVLFISLRRLILLT